MSKVIPPFIDPDDRHFWEGVERRELLIQCCSSCHLLRHPPAPMCGSCGSLDWHAQPAKGRATIYSWIVSQHPTEEDDEPRIVALVDLEEGVRFVSNLVDVDIDEVHHGQSVRLVFVETDGVLLPQFKPGEEEI